VSPAAVPASGLAGSGIEVEDGLVCITQTHGDVAMTRFSRMPATAAVLALIGALLPFNAHAQTVTMGQFRHPRSEAEMNSYKAYLTAVRDGLIAYNMTADTKLFCTPGNPYLPFEQLSEIVMRWARKKNIDADKLPLGLVLLYGMKETYPCSN
jgi:predicted regulator of Ras-like GTPase activity (Roadblock/LC7/MglB family)